MSGESVINPILNKDDIDSDSDFIFTKFEEWDNKRDEVKNEWGEIQEYIFARTVLDISNSATHEHTTHTPELATIREDLIAVIFQSMFPHDDWFRFEPGSKEANNKEIRDAVRSYVKNRRKLNGSRAVHRRMVEDLVDTGNCFGMTFYKDAPENPGREYVGPKERRISPWDIVFDPTADNFEDSPKIIKERVTMGEFYERYRESEVARQDVVDKVLNSRTQAAIDSIDARRDTTAYRSGFSNLGEYLSSGVIELRWFYGDIFDLETMTLRKNRMIVAVDNWVLIDKEIGTWNGKPHITHYGWKPYPDMLWAQGPLAQIIGLNYQIDHRENAKADGLDKLINPDKLMLGDIQEVWDEEENRFVYLGPEGASVQDVAINAGFLSFDTDIDRKMTMMRSASRMPNDLRGFRTEGEKTFGEFSGLIEGGMRGFLHKIEGYEEHILQPTLSAYIELARKHLDSAIKVPAEKDGQFTRLVEVSPASLKVDGVFIPEGATRLARKNQILSTLSQLSATGLMQIASPHISGKGTAKLLEELTETTGSGMFEDFAGVKEQAEMQQEVNQLEQQQASQLAEPTVQEELDARELGDV